MAIEYQKEEVEFDLPNVDHLTNWLMAISESKQKKISLINYIFCSDEYLLAINKEYLNHDYYTDIITFPYKQGKEIESDIFISIDRVTENAMTFDTSFEKELLRVMSHGLLHLLGYKDNTEEDINEMRENEEKAIEMFYKNVNE